MTTPAPNVLLIGGSGSGKTTSIRTLVDAGVETRAIMTEPRWAPLRSIPCSKGLHLAYLPPTSGSWQSLMDRSYSLTEYSWEQNLKMGDKNKSHHKSFVNLIVLLHNFKCDRCGKEFGDVTTWSSDTAFVLDSLSGLNHMAMQMVVGLSVSKSQPQWGAAMDSELQLINKLCYETQCWFVLTSHPERLISEVDPSIQIQVNALGRKNAPEIPKNFDEVVYCRREADHWFWSTIAPGVDTKMSLLPASDKIPPDFGPIVREWRKQVEAGEWQQPTPQVAAAPLTT